MTLRRPASRQAGLALCLVVLLGSGAIVLAQPQDPGRPYWSDNWRGWHFYEEPEIPPPEPPASAPQQATPASSAATAPRRLPAKPPGSPNILRTAPHSRHPTRARIPGIVWAHLPVAST